MDTKTGGLEKYGSGGGCRNRDRGGWVGKNMAVVVVVEIETEEGGSDGLLSVTGGRPLTLLLLLLLLLLSPFVQLLPPPLSTWASAAATRYMLHDTDYMSHAAYMLNAFFCLLIYPQ